MKKVLDIAYIALSGGMIVVLIAMVVRNIRRK